MNNYEKLVKKFLSMSIDELAKYIYKHDDKQVDAICESQVCPHGDNVECSDCVNCVKKWLLSEAEPVKNCDTCLYYFEDRREQPCCGCVDFVNWERDDSERYVVLPDRYCSYGERKEK